jgi:hypothetical protein
MSNMSIRKDPMIKFGCLNVETGEFKEGYVEEKLGKKEMKYRNPLPWWKRMFGMKDIQPLWGKPEYVSATILYIYVGERRVEYEAPIYKQTHLNGNIRYYIRDHKANYGKGLDRPIEPVAFEKEGKEIFI